MIPGLVGLDGRASVTDVSQSQIDGDPAASFDYDTIEAGLYDRIFHRGSGIQSKWHRLKFEYVARHLEPGQRHLDLGCGPGTFIGTLEDSIESVGVDLADSQIQYARAAYGTPTRRFEVVRDGSLGFDNATFDVVTCIEVLEHLPMDTCTRLLDEARRVLRPDGVLLLSTPNYGGPWPVIEWVVNRLSDVSYEDQHITPFTRRRLSSLLGNTGFADHRIRGFQFAAPFAAALGWNFADRVRRFEPGFLTSRFGLLLFARARPA